MNHRPYENLEAPDSDQILQLSQEFAAVKNARPDAVAVNGVVGIFQKPDGGEFVFPEVLAAWEDTEFGRPNYLPASGDPEFIKGVQDLVFGDGADQIRENGIATLGTPGGTGALSAWAKFHAKTSPDTPILISDPTWPNHTQIFDDYGVKSLHYDHLANGKYDLEAHAAAIENAPPGTVVLFHAGKTHNPTGENPQTKEEWKHLISRMDGKQALVDMAYLGFGGEIDEDLEPIPTLLKAGVPLSVCVSFSKNMALYKERTGALLMPTATREEAAVVQAHLARCARTLWSNPPAQGERVSGKVLADRVSRESWIRTLRNIANVIAVHRLKLASTLGGNFSFLAKQSGLFSLLPLSADAVERLKREEAIFLLPLPNDQARLSVMGVPEQQIERFAEAVRRVAA